MSEPAIKLLVIALYFATVLVIGAVAYRRTQNNPEDYFLGGRSARTVVLFMALFGTNVTPFVLMGIPGLSYHLGIGVFGYNAAIVALGIPITFYLIGYPAWLAAKKIGAVTPAELYAKRLRSPSLGRLLFLAFFLYTVPYMVTAVSGVGLAVDVLSGGSVDFEWASAGILGITILYTSLGGMRATMWTNVFQGAVFLCFTVLAFFLIAGEMGGLSSIMSRIQARSPELLYTPERPPFVIGNWASWGLAIACTVIAFPHMLVRIFAAKDVTALKNACRYYPLALVLLWIPAVMFGVWGTLEFPDLVGKASDRVFPMLVSSHLGPALQGLALAGILAAVMSTLDAQMLTLSSMLTRDVIPDVSERTQVRIGRIFLVLLAVLTYLIVMAKPASIFEIAKLSFSGYTILVPTLYLGLRWNRFTAQGAMASILLGNAALLVAYWEWIPGMDLGVGVLPVAWAFAVAILAGIGVSMATERVPE